MAYPWPGNIRELSNEMERAATLTEGPVVRPGDLSPRIAQAGGYDSRSDFSAEFPETRAPSRPSAQNHAEHIRRMPLGDLKEIMREETQRIESVLIERALQETGNNKAECSRLLGLSREGLRKKMHRYGIPAQRDGRNKSRPDRSSE